MKRSKKNIALIIILVTPVVLGTGCLSLAGGCGNEVIREIESPDKKHRVVVFQRDCGATTGFSTQVSILPGTTRLPEEGGNVFACDTDHGKAPTGPGGGPPVEIEWKGNDSLLITHDYRAGIFLSADSSGGVKIIYAKKTF
ncbi:MAG: hypothetical protein WAV47_06460 [Blastocatellia bacterium]